MPLASFCLFSIFFKQKYEFLQHINVNNVFPVYIAGIWTRNLFNMSLLN